MAGGRPTTYNNVIAKKILERLAEGETVTSICKDKDMPVRSTVFLWASTHKEFSDQYLMAIKGVGQIKVDNIQNTLQDMREGKIDAAMASVEISALKWMAGKFYPKMYGEKQLVESENTNINLNAQIELSEADKAILRRFGMPE